MKRKRQPKSKQQLLAESAEKTLANAAKQRNAITLGKMDRMLALGLQAREREVLALLQPVHADITDFLKDLQPRYEVTIGKTHSFSWDNLEFTPLPETPAEEKAPDRVDAVPVEEPKAPEASPAIN